MATQITTGQIKDGSITTAKVADANVTDAKLATAKEDLNITLNAKTGSYTLILSDNGKEIKMNVASANNVTIPPQ